MGAPVPTDSDRAFLARQLVQATLPHSDPGDVPVWTRTNGRLTLVVRPHHDHWCRHLGSRNAEPRAGSPSAQPRRLEPAAGSAPTQVVEIGGERRRDHLRPIHRSRPPCLPPFARPL